MCLPLIYFSDRTSYSLSHVNIPWYALEGVKVENRAMEVAELIRDLKTYI
jgi:hypothetical protein